MRELDREEVRIASGAGGLPPSVVRFAPGVGQVATTYVAAYETATWLGAETLGESIGNAIYEFAHS